MCSEGKVALAFNSLALLLFGFPGFLPWLFWSVEGRFLDLLEVENILFPPRSQFVLNQLFPSLLSILTDLPNRVCGLGKLAHGYESRPDRDTLPIAVVLRFLFSNARDLAN